MRSPINLKSFIWSKIHNLIFSLINSTFIYEFNKWHHLQKQPQVFPNIKQFSKQSNPHVYFSNRDLLATPPTQPRQDSKKHPSDTAEFSRKRTIFNLKTYTYPGYYYTGLLTRFVPEDKRFLILSERVMFALKERFIKRAMFAEHSGVLDIIYCT